jgi:Family of unknown function (DUF5335)
MSLVDVSREQWPEFLESFSGRHRGWLASVEQSDLTGTTLVADAQPLLRVTAERDGPDISAIRILFAAVSGASEVRLQKPTRVRVDRMTEDAERGLEIVDEDGIRTRVGFRATATPEMLDGLAPAEI